MQCLLDLRIDVRVSGGNCSNGNCSNLRLRIVRLIDQQLAVVLSPDEDTKGRTLTNCFERVAAFVVLHHLQLWLQEGGSMERIEWYEDRTAPKNGHGTPQSGDVFRVHFRPDKPLRTQDFVHVPLLTLAERGLVLELAAC